MILLITEFALALVLLALSFCYSGSEVSLFSLSELDRIKLNRDQNKSRKNALIVRFLNHPERALITILFGNMLVNLSASIVGERLAGGVFQKNPFFFSVFIMTFCIVLFGEILPKNIAANKPISAARALIGVVNATYRAFYPLIYLLTRGVARTQTASKTLTLTKDELVSAAEVGEEAGIDGATIYLLKNLIGLIDRSVTDIMVPRAAISAVGLGSPWKNIEGFIKDSPHADVLFFGENIDEIIGYASKVDLMGVSRRTLSSTLREPIFVPESKSILSLLNDFKQHRGYMAIVLDEYSGTVGLVTLKDVLDSIFTRDMLLDRMITKKSDREWLVRGETRITDFNHYFKTRMSGGARTVSGFVVDLSGTIPSPGYSFDYLGGFTFTILKSDDKRVELLELKKNDL
jgi:CBS domain containing-hemolysin-like protein